jgi:hypothetical protein
MFRRKSSFSIQVLPEWGSNVTLRTPKHIHPFLRLSDAQTFVFVLKAGAIMYYSPITDPLFAAHKTTAYFKRYIPVRGATGIGCAEQTQVCIDFLSGLK